MPGKWRIGALNPEGESKVSAILSEHQACTSGVSNRVTERFLRKTAGALGAEKLQRLVDFYPGPDLARFEALLGAAPSEAGEKDAEAILARYPLQEFNTALGGAFAEIAADEAFLSALGICAAAQAAAFEREKLRTE
jgi:hypothetical protein